MPDAPANQPTPPPHIPDFELLRRIGRGSYGEVWLARSVTGALRAVKIVHRNRFDSVRPYEREFQGIQKYEPVSRSAAGLVHLLHVSRGEDFFYYVMELADDANEPAAVESANKDTPDGNLRTPTASPNTDALMAEYSPRTLTSDLRQRGRLPFAECLRIGLALTHGLEQLHSGGLIHRDLKPSNIIFVRGEPKLADIGLVTDADATRTLVGTEGYLPPDGGGTASADLYSLGKVLYEISTGMDRQSFPVMPPEFAAWPDRTQVLELSEIFERACEASPADRYASAAEMRAELELLAAGESVVRRHRLGRLSRQAAWVTAVAALAACLVGLGWWGRHAQRSARDYSTVAQANNEWQAGLKALEMRTPESLSNAIVHFDRAARLDPVFAMPLAGRAEALALLADHQPAEADRLWLEARATAEAALRLAPRLASPQFTLGLVAMNHEFDWPRAGKHFRAGLAIDPNSANGHLWHASLLGALGQPAEALAEARRAVELDPTSRSANATLGVQLHLARRYDEAAVQYRRTLTMAPDFKIVRLHLSRLYLVTDRWHEGLIERLRSFPDTPEGKARRWELEKVRQTLGAYVFWREWLATPEARMPVSAFTRAEAHMHLSDFEAALKALGEAVAQRDTSVINLAVDPLFDQVRTNEAFLVLCDQLKLPRDAAATSLLTAAQALTDGERAAGLTSEEKAAGFRAIFDGRTLKGWRSDLTNWMAEDGAVTMTRSGGAKPSHLRYTGQTVPDNFELRFEWKVQPNGNSGVNYRPGFVQYQVIDNGLITSRDAWNRKAGSLLAFIGHQTRDCTRPVGEWNTARIVCYGTTIEHHLNGVSQFRNSYTQPGLSNLVASLDREEMKRIQTTFGNVRARGGFLSLQDEGLPGASFRHLRWRKLE